MFSNLSQKEKVLKDQPKTSVSVTTNEGKKLLNILFLYIFSRYEWISNPTFFDVLEDGFQTLRIPKSGNYRFEVIAPGWSSEVPGARVCGLTYLKKGRGK